MRGLRAPSADLWTQAAGGERRVDLFLMRHGKAGARTPSAADSSRALTSAGTREVKKTASGLRRAGISFDHVASSPLTRAMQTARIVAAAAGAAAGSGAAAGGGRKKGAKPARPPSVHRWDELKPEAAAESALGRIAGLAYDSSVLLVGHEPCMTTLLGLLVSGGAGAGAGRRGTPAAAAARAPFSINLKKGGMARLRILSTVPEVRGELRWLATPRHMECLQ